MFRFVFFAFFLIFLNDVQAKVIPFTVGDLQTYKSLDSGEKLSYLMDFYKKTKQSERRTAKSLTKSSRLMKFKMIPRFKRFPNFHRKSKASKDISTPRYTTSTKTLRRAIRGVTICLLIPTILRHGKIFNTLPSATKALKTISTVIQRTNSFPNPFIRMTGRFCWRLAPERAVKRKC